MFPQRHYFYAHGITAYIINTESTNYFDKKLRRKLGRGWTEFFINFLIFLISSAWPWIWPDHVCGWNYKNWKLGNILPRAEWSHASPGPMTAVKPRHAALLYVNIAGQNVCNASALPSLHSAYWGPGYILSGSDLYPPAQTQIRPPEPDMYSYTFLSQRGRPQSCLRAILDKDSRSFRK